MTQPKTVTATASRRADRGTDAVSKDPQWETELRETNTKKNGAPFRYAESLIESMAVVRAASGLSYRRISEMINEMTRETTAPDHTTVFRRMRKVKMPKIDSNLELIGRWKNLIVFAVDAPAPELHGTEWIRERWHMKHGFVRMHKLIDVDTGIMLAIAITNSSAGDSKMLKVLQGRGLVGGNKA